MLLVPSTPPAPVPSPSIWEAILLLIIRICSALGIGLLGGMIKVPLRRVLGAKGSKTKKPRGANKICNSVMQHLRFPQYGPEDRYTGVLGRMVGDGEEISTAFNAESTAKIVALLSNVVRNLNDVSSDSYAQEVGALQETLGSIHGAIGGIRALEATCSLAVEIPEKFNDVNVAILNSVPVPSPTSYPGGPAPLETPTKGKEGADAPAPASAVASWPNPWQFFGFQSQNPNTDWRGSGALGGVVLAHYGKVLNPQSAWGAAATFTARDLHNGYIPFAVLSIQVTVDLMRSLRADVGKLTAPQGPGCGTPCSGAPSMFGEGGRGGIPGGALDLIVGIKDEIKRGREQVPAFPKELVAALKCLPMDKEARKDAILTIHAFCILHHYLVGMLVEALAARLTLDRSSKWWGVVSAAGQKTKTPGSTGKSVPVAAIPLMIAYPEIKEAVVVGLLGSCEVPAATMIKALPFSSHTSF